MLTEINRRLDKQFTVLRGERAASGLPVFAQEHGLSKPEVHALKDSLSGELKRKSKLDHTHWHFWAAVAAEVGCSLDGVEFWTSFDGAVPGESAMGSRSTIRDCYVRFLPVGGGKTSANSRARSRMAGKSNTSGGVTP